jgi:hypothetical protein
VEGADKMCECLGCERMKAGGLRDVGDSSHGLACSSLAVRKLHGGTITAGGVQTT